MYRGAVFLRQVINSARERSLHLHRLEACLKRGMSVVERYAVLSAEDAAGYHLLELMQLATHFLRNGISGLSVESSLRQDTNLFLNLDSADVEGFDPISDD